MPISHRDWYRSLDMKAIGKAFDEARARWDALSPEQRAIE